ncbi:3-hydroxyacyl-CoA dehydrogenase NAD-binding domain-containing protein [Leisingera thetidis]|uniref:3-hydroxyacyl-CoA dehydrogenase NAD-binding domain-containing protein n=1 Tax=Leisingera thetidis TaxID=2930199 RepID=UPI0021F6D8EE|nr:3-hydroxyacyl-CoA dehydrogenase NAD-binding domain-containing protein [Leisingera thetidis]
MALRYKISGGTCIITLDNPPLNVVGQTMRRQLNAALDSAEIAQAERIIVTGAGRAFSAGSDAREFNAPPQEPHLPDVLNRLETMGSIAAINGIALGAGLEIALACRYRIAAPEALLGLPEVTLGVVPGAGGTQRLPRITGLAKAAGLITQGGRIGALAAEELGLVDEVAPDTLTAAQQVPARVLAAALPASALPAPQPEPGLFSNLRQTAAKRTRGQTAPQVALDLLEAATRLPFSEAMAQERTSFLELRQTEQAAALRHVFFAETAAKSQGTKRGSRPTPIETALVVGGGSMGAGIAYALDQAKVAVTVVEASISAADKARANIASLFDQAVKRDKISAQEAETGKARIAVQTGYGSLPAFDIAIEAVFEDLNVKCQVFAELDAVLPTSAILATNTSYLDVNKVFEGISAPSRCLGLHFFSPAHLMKLLEIIPGAGTTNQTLASVFGLAARLGKIPVEAGVCDGFIGNRILTRYRQICDVMLLEGALPWQIDKAMTGFGMAMGPYAVQDLSGLDIAYANRQRKNLSDAEGIRYIPIADRMVEELERLGRKTGAGWYDYPGAAEDTSPSVVTELIETASREAGVIRRDFSDEEIADRAITAMIDEGLRILDEGIAHRAADIDLVLVHGYGFPRWRGGPMHFAEKVGLDQLRRRIATYAKNDPLSWSVPSLLDSLIAGGLNLANFDTHADKTG